MDNYLIDDDFLYKHMKSAEDIILDNLPIEEELSHNFSRKFNKEVKMLFKEERKSPYFNKFVHHGKKVAIGFVIIVSVLLATTLSIEALRERIFGKTVSKYSDRTSISYDTDDEILEDLVAKIPAYIPAGFTLDKRDLTSTQNMNIYKNKKGVEIYYHQSVAAGSTVILDTEGVEVEYINIDDQKVMSYTNKGFNNLYWDDEVYIYFFNSSIDMDELIKMAESLQHK